ncbi:hypothetical protein CMUS01_01778 [Colletotrichum musicola]|uniref:Uncharacterized protein n=1 Tax=Colletotrichum musicola TaxID=2175873 RepID=A0A8H6NWI7_9PEZI|nr:hypothetical protein CMUS01_01778 [Colletotrichum musicola]
MYNVHYTAAGPIHEPALSVHLEVSAPAALCDCNCNCNCNYKYLKPIGLKVSLQSSSCLVWEGGYLGRPREQTGEWANSARKARSIGHESHFLSSHLPLYYAALSGRLVSPRTPPAANPAPRAACLVGPPSPEPLLSVCDGPCSPTEQRPWDVRTDIMSADFHSAEERLGDGALMPFDAILNHG